MRDHWWQFWRPDVANPGSQEAAMAGCLCPVTINKAGRTKPENGWVVRSACPIHGEMTKGTRPLNEAP